jgi:RNA polymerase sigma factor for flagellar operon FliA
MKTMDKEKLWEAYRKKPTSELREQLILEYAQLVKLVAGRLSMYLGYNVEYEELVSYGIFGLIDAIDKFDTEKNVKFETYASLRIRGSILDQIRKMDWIPRTVRQRQRKMDDAIKQVEMRTGKSATDEELAKELGLSEDELGNWQSQLKVTNIVSLNEFEENNGPEPVADTSHQSHFQQPEEVVEEEELKEMLSAALDLLTEKERRVIELYYYEDMNLKEISQILEVSESRVSQLHTKGLLKMRKKMGPYMEILVEQ